MYALLKIIFSPVWLCLLFAVVVFNHLSASLLFDLFLSLSLSLAAPEIINQDIPTLASDMWSVGVLTYVL